MLRPGYRLLRGRAKREYLYCELSLQQWSAPMHHQWLSVLSRPADRLPELRRLRSHLQRRSELLERQVLLVGPDELRRFLRHHQYRSEQLWWLWERMRKWAELSERRLRVSAGNGQLCTEGRARTTRCVYVPALGRASVVSGRRTIRRPVQG
jgi:hypothetical protein